MLLDAISRSDGTPRGRVAKLFETDLPDTVVGSISFDENGDPKDGTRDRLHRHRTASGYFKESKALELATTS